MKFQHLFTEADILLPHFEKKEDYTRWATIACDQFTSETEYWTELDALVGAAPSALRVVLPEVYLSSDNSDRIAAINETMRAYLDTLLTVHKDAMIYLERTQPNGKIRRGLVGKIDLECYEYTKGSAAPIRATEGTVLERIPPRVAIRRNAPIELPHVMLLADDPKNTILGPVTAGKDGFETAYDFDMNMGGGHIAGYFLDGAAIARVKAAIDALAAEGGEETPLVFAVGDGNHSLASAKASFEEVKARIGAEAAATHPARYALVELVNLHDEALEFEPIYRVLFGADPTVVLEKFRTYAAALDGTARPQEIRVVYGGKEETITVAHPNWELAVGTVGDFVEAYAKETGAVVDYIHGIDSTEKLAAGENAIGFLFAGMEKGDLFPSVKADGALPRKTFSMGEARDKRYYLEARRITD